MAEVDRAHERLSGPATQRILKREHEAGSVWINYSIAEMMKAMLVEFTKSRACRSQDNALVEGENGAIIRKLIGYGHIPAGPWEKLQTF